MKGNLALQKLCSKTARFVKRNSSTILTIAGAAGMIATVVTAVAATKKAVALTNAAKEEKGEDLTTTEVLATVAPSYIPTILLGGATLACMFGANALSRRQQASIVSAYMLVDGMHKEYQDKVKELLGEETHTRIRDAIAMDHCKDAGGYVPGYGSLDTNGETRLFYEEYRGRYFESTIEAVLNAEYHLNRNFSMRGYANLNEFYEFLGLSETEEGEVLGWSQWQLAEQYEATWIDFSNRLVTMEDGLECYVIEFPIPPTVDYEEDYCN
jgi:hypothetical protein